MNKRILATLLALALALTLLPTAALGAEPNLDAIAYVVGDRSECKMDAAMANAYIEAIEQAKEELRQRMESGEGSQYHGEPYDRNRDALYVALADIAGDGYPILITTALDKTGNSPNRDWSEGTGLPLHGDGVVGPSHVWSYKDGVATPLDEPFSISYVIWEGKGALHSTNYPISVDEPKWETIYTVAQGEITLAHELRAYYYYIGEYEYNSNYVLDKSGDYWRYATDNGVNVTQEYLSREGWFDYEWTNIWFPGESYFVDLDWCPFDTTPADQAIAALRGWAAAPVVPTYKVTLRLDTGDVAVNTAQDQPMTVPTNPTKAGYTFGGWYLDAELTRPWNFNTTVTGDMELYGKWTPLTSTAAATGRSSQAITVNGAPVKLEAYTLAADSNGGDVTFVKLRDVAAVLDGSEAQFNVEWKNGAIYVTTKSAYTGRNGTELQPIVVDTTGYEQNTSPVLFDGETRSLEGIVITDIEGGGHTFFKLRDLADAIGFTVDWTAERGIYIETE